MRRKEEYELQKVTLNLRRGDFDRLRTLHGREGAGKIVRGLVIGHLNRVDKIVAGKSHLNPSIIPEEEDII